MKKFFAMMLALVMALSLVACGKQPAVFSDFHMSSSSLPL